MTLEVGVDDDPYYKKFTDMMSEDAENAYSQVQTTADSSEDNSFVENSPRKTGPDSPRNSPDSEEPRKNVYNKRLMTFTKFIDQESIHDDGENRDYLPVCQSAGLSECKICIIGDYWVSAMGNMTNIEYSNCQHFCCYQFANKFFFHLKQLKAEASLSNFKVLILAPFFSIFWSLKSIEVDNATLRLFTPNDMSAAKFFFKNLRKFTKEMKEANPSIQIYLFVPPLCDFYLYNSRIAHESNIVLRKSDNPSLKAERFVNFQRELHTFIKKVEEKAFEDGIKVISGQIVLDSLSQRHLKSSRKFFNKELFVVPCYKPHLKDGIYPSKEYTKAFWNGVIAASFKKPSPPKMIQKPSRRESRDRSRYRSDSPTSNPKPLMDQCSSYSSKSYSNKKKKQNHDYSNNQVQQQHENNYHMNNQQQQFGNGQYMNNQVQQNSQNMSNQVQQNSQNTNNQVQQNSQYMNNQVQQQQNSQFFADPIQMQQQNQFINNLTQQMDQNQLMNGLIPQHSMNQGQLAMQANFCQQTAYNNPNFNRLNSPVVLEYRNRLQQEMMKFLNEAAYQRSMCNVPITEAEVKLLLCQTIMRS